MNCKLCGSSAVVRFGTYKGTQLYWCKVCQRKFKADDALFHMKVSAEHISSALSMYYRGMSYKDIADHMQQEHNYRPSKHTVFNWIDKYTTLAIRHFRGYKPQVGNIWVADETMLDVDNHKLWFWDIIDSKTRFLLASRVSLARTSEDAQKLMESAYRRAGKAPKAVVTDKLRSYLDGIELTFGSDTEHTQASPFAMRDSKDSTALVERFHGTLKDRTKVMRGFRDVDTLIQFTDGFLAYYNFIRPHEALDGKTPAEAAQIDYKVKNWADLSRLPVSKESEIRSHRISKVRVQAQMPRTKVRLPKKPRKPKRTRRVGKTTGTQSSITMIRG